MEDMRDAQGKFLERLMGGQNPPAHGASSVKIVGGDRGWEIPALCPLSSLESWWPGTELNRRRQPFPGYVMLCFKQLK